MDGFLVDEELRLVAIMMRFDGTEAKPTFIPIFKLAMNEQLLSGRPECEYVIEELVVLMNRAIRCHDVQAILVPGKGPVWKEENWMQ
jgi:hypothetical protein